MKAMYSTEQRGRYEAYYSNLRHEKHREEKHHHDDEVRCHLITIVNTSSSS